MNRNGLAFVGLVLCAAAVCGPAHSAEGPSPPVVGTWQLTGFLQEYLDTKEVTRPYGDRPTGYIQYSPGGHVVVFLARDDLPRPAAAAYTDADHAAVHKGIIGAYAGTYRVEGNKVINRILTAWRPEWIGGDQTRYFEIEGRTLTIKTAPLKERASGRDIVGSLTFVRVE